MLLLAKLCQDTVFLVLSLGASNFEETVWVASYLVYKHEWCLILISVIFPKKSNYYFNQKLAQLVYGDVYV